MFTTFFHFVQSGLRHNFNLAQMDIILRPSKVLSCKSRLDKCFSRCFMDLCVSITHSFADSGNQGVHEHEDHVTGGGGHDIRQTNTKCNEQPKCMDNKEEVLVYFHLEMGDTIGIAHRYFGLRYQISVSLDLKHRY